MSAEPKSLERAAFHQMKDGTAEDWAIIGRHFQPLAKGLPDRVMAHLEAAGYGPEIQSGFHCNPALGHCSPVENIVAVKQGMDGRHALLVTAHYDSGWAGPGAADDGAALAAILEIARMAADYPPYANSIVFLLAANSGKIPVSRAMNLTGLSLTNPKRNPKEAS